MYLVILFTLNYAVNLNLNHKEEHLGSTVVVTVYLYT